MSYCGRKTNDRFRCNPCNVGYLRRIKKYNKKRRQLVLEYYGGACVCCGETAYEFLEVDHRNGDPQKGWLWSLYYR